MDSTSETKQHWKKPQTSSTQQKPVLNQQNFDIKKSGLFNKLKLSASQIETEEEKKQSDQNYVIQPYKKRVFNCNNVKVDKNNPLEKFFGDTSLIEKKTKNDFNVKFGEDKE